MYILNKKNEKHKKIMCVMHIKMKKVVRYFGINIHFLKSMCYNEYYLRARQDEVMI